MNASLVYANPVETIVLNGTVRRGKYLIRVNGIIVPLTATLFEVFVDLVRARLTMATGLSSLPSLSGAKNRIHVTICRLRRTIDNAIGKGTGVRLIVHAAASDYFLDIPSAAITVEPAITDLAPNHLAAYVVADLIKNRASDDSVL